MIGAFVVFVKVSLMFPEPVVPASVIPAIVALDHVITVLPLEATVALVAVYAKVDALQIEAGLNVLDNAGVGFTVIVAVCVDPVHPFAVGVTVIVPLIAEFVVFVAVNVGTDVAPDGAKPILVLLFDQAYVVPVTLNVEAKVTAVDVTPAQSVCALIASTVGVGLTETTTSFVALHPFDVIV